MWSIGELHQGPSEFNPHSGISRLRSSGLARAITYPGSLSDVKAALSSPNIAGDSVNDAGRNKRFGVEMLPKAFSNPLGLAAFQSFQ